MLQLHIISFERERKPETPFIYIYLKRQSFTIYVPCGGGIISGGHSNLLAKESRDTVISVSAIRFHNSLCYS